MAATLTSLRDRIEEILADDANAIWAADTIDEGIRLALDTYSKARPYQAIDTLTLAADGREIDVSGVTGLLNITRVWLPYTAATPEHPPRWRVFEHWQDAQILYIEDDVEGTPTNPLGFGAPSSGDVARLFYTQKQTLNGLDSATATTFADDDESMIAWAASGYAILTEATKATKHAQIDAMVPISEQLRKLAEMRIKTFMDQLGLTGGDGSGTGDRPAKVTVKRLTRQSFYQSGYPGQQPEIPT